MSAGFLNPAAGLGGNMPADPTGDLIARQKLAELLSGTKGRYNDASPKQHWMQALAQTADGAFEGLSARQQLAAALAGQAQANSLLGSMPAGASAATGPMGGSASPAAAATRAAVSIPGSLGNLDNNNLDVAVRTAMAEAGGLGPSGMRDVAAVLRNRALLSGKSLADEALAPNQFEPWNAGSKNDPRRFKVDSPEYQSALAAVRPILEGSEADPTGGATFFYAPKAQASLGRKAPSWDDGSGEDRGAHRFFRLPYAGKDPASLAQASAAKPNASAAVPASGDDDQAAADAPAPAPVASNAAPDDLRAQLQATFDAKRAGAGGPDTAFTAFAGEPQASDGDMPSVPPAAPSAVPQAAPVPVLPAPAPQGDPAPAPAGGPAVPSMVGMPSPDMPAPVPQNVPLPPQRPSDADLAAPAPGPVDGVNPATAPGQPATRGGRAQIAQALAQPIVQPRTDAPDPQSAPGLPRDNLIKQLMGGAQDGLDRIFGGPQTQARLDAQASPRARLAEALVPPAPKPVAYASLPAGGGVPQAVPSPAAPGPQPTGPAPAAAAAAPAPAPPAPVQVAQAGPASTQADQVAWAQRVMAASAANPAVAKLVPLAQKVLERSLEGNYGQEERDGRVINVAPNGQRTVLYDKSKDDQDKYGTFTDQATGVTYQYKKGSNDAPTPLSPGGARASRVTDIVDPQERAAAGVPADYKGAVQRDANGKLLFPSAGGVNVTTNLGPKANEALDGTIIKKIEESQSKAEGAIGTLKAINRQKQAIDGGLLTGWGADWQTQARAAAAKLLGLPDDALTNSEKFDAASTQKSAELAKAISQAGHTTNMDLQLGKTIAGGNRETTEKAIRAIVEAQERLALDTIEEHNRKVDKFAKINPSVADRAAWFKMEAPEVYQYGQDKAQAGAAPAAAPAPAAAAPAPSRIRRYNPATGALE